MAVTARRRSATLVATAMVFVTLVAVVWMLVRNAVVHPGEHFESGREARGVSGSLWAGGVDGEPNASGSCFYVPRNGLVYVPVVLKARTDGALTFAVTATVTNRPDGYDGDEHDGGNGKVVASVSSDIPFDGYNLKTYPMTTYLNIPLAEAAWDSGTNDCAMRWTMTPGAWFPDHD